MFQKTRDVKNNDKLEDHNLPRERNVRCFDTILSKLKERQQR